MSDANMKVALDLNAVRVSMKDLLLASSEVHKLPPEDRDWDGRLHLMVRLFPGERLKASAVDLRLTAMSKLIKSGVLANWVLPEAGDGSTSIAEPVWMTTATAPLLLSDDKAYFDESSFIEAVLVAAPNEGRA